MFASEVIAQEMNAHRGKFSGKEVTTGLLAGAMAALLAACSGDRAADDDAAAGRAEPRDIAIAGERVFPESITSDMAGNIYVGSVGGTIYRALAGETTARPWIEPDEENGLNSVFGVLVSGTRLWACSNPPFGAQPDPTGPDPAAPRTALKRFDLATGALDASYDFPAGPAFCNDIAVSAEGTTYVTETGGGRIFALAPGEEELRLFAEEEELVGVDGIAFSEDGTMYINNVRENLLQRVERRSDGGYSGLTTLTLSRPLDGPDGLRPVSGNLFLQAEGPGGRVALIKVEGDSATVTPVREGLESSPAVTRIGSTGYATEGKIEYLVDPALQGQDPGPFVIRAFPLPEGL